MNHIRDFLHGVYIIGMVYLIISVIFFIVSSIMADYAKKHEIKSGIVRFMINGQEEFLYDAWYAFLTEIFLLVVYNIVWR